MLQRLQHVAVAIWQREHRLVIDGVCVAGVTCQLQALLRRYDILHQTFLLSVIHNTAWYKTFGDGERALHMGNDASGAFSQLLGLLD